MYILIARNIKPSLWTLFLGVVFSYSLAVPQTKETEVLCIFFLQFFQEPNRFEISTELPIVSTITNTFHKKLHIFVVFFYLSGIAYGY